VLIRRGRMRKIYGHQLIINRPVEDVFFYLGHTFENASVWMDGCRRVVAQPGYEAYGMWLGKKYFRTMAMPFRIFNLKKPEKCVAFENNKRFVMTTEILNVQPHWNYEMRAIGDNKTEFNYSVTVGNNGIFSRLFIQPLFLWTIKGRLEKSHHYMKALFDDGLVLSKSEGGR